MSEKGEILYRVPLQTKTDRKMCFEDTFKSTSYGQNHPEKKTPNGDKVANNIVIPSFYKNIIFTSLSETSFLRLYTVQGNNKRN